MKACEIDVGSKVICTNQFNLQYEVIEKFSRFCTLMHTTGEMTMLGGKMIPEVYVYPKVKYSAIKQVLS